MKERELIALKIEQLRSICKKLADANDQPPDQAVESELLIHIFHLRTGYTQVRHFYIQLLCEKNRKIRALISKERLFYCTSHNVKLKKAWIVRVWDIFAKKNLNISKKSQQLFFYFHNA